MIPVRCASFRRGNLWLILYMLSLARSSIFALPRFHHDSLTVVPSLKAPVKPIEKMFCRRGEGRTGMGSVPEHASRMWGKSLPCWCLSDLVQINAWRDHAPNLCQMAHNIGMQNLVVPHVPHDSDVGICTPNKQRSLQIIWACYSTLRIKGSRQRAGYSSIL